MKNEKVEKAIADFDKVRTYYENFGTFDSEPEYRFERIKMCAENGKLYNFSNMDSRRWELYTMPGCEAAAQALTEAAKKVYNSILESKMA